MSAVQLVWLRNDLRLRDHPAIAQAQQQGPVRLVVCDTPEQWQAHDESPAKVSLRLAIWRAIRQEAEVIGVPFDVLPMASFADCAQALLAHAEQFGANALWFQSEAPLDECRRDQQVEQHFLASGLHVQVLPPDDVVPERVVNQQGQPYRVFTPFYRQWLRQLMRSLGALGRASGDCQAQNEDMPSSVGQIPGRVVHRDDLWPALETEVLNKLDGFLQRRFWVYNERRDFPSQSACSALSPHWALGQIGRSEILSRLQMAYVDRGQDPAEWLQDPWLRQLAWRDFFRALMREFPRLSRHQAFRQQDKALRWDNDEVLFQAWCQGNTGFPIIDAGMRQLQQTGWMHNRVRMLTASFLCKLMLIDWRWGERFFMQHLVDGDFCANNSSWQWSASVGCDAVPYFRIFNPWTQSRKFDADGEYIRRFVPELGDLSNRDIHQPSAEQCKACDYPLPVIDYPAARERALQRYADAFASS